jgi:hypothetical protein
MSHRRTIFYFLFALVLVANLATAAVAGCFSTSRDGASHPASCNMAGTYSQYSPAQETYCGFSINPCAGCNQRTVALQRQQSVWSNQDCSGTLITSGPWTNIGTATLATNCSCC